MVGDVSLGNGRGGDAGARADAGREGTLLPGLKREREERGLSLQDLEERTGLDVRYIHEIEVGREGARSPLMHGTLARELGVPLEALEIPGESGIPREERLDLALKVAYRPGLSDELPYSIAGDLHELLGLKTAHDVVRAVEEDLAARVERGDAVARACRRVGFIDTVGALFFAASPTAGLIQPVLQVLRALARERWGARGDGAKPTGGASGAEEPEAAETDPKAWTVGGSKGEEKSTQRGEGQSLTTPHADRLFEVETVASPGLLEEALDALEPLTGYLALEERRAEEANKLLGPIVDVLVRGGRL